MSNRWKAIKMSINLVYTSAHFLTTSKLEWFLIRETECYIWRLEALVLCMA